MSRRALPVAAALLLLAPAHAGASRTRPAAALSVSPARVRIAGAARTTIRLANPGHDPLVVDVARGNVALDLRGRPRVVPRGRTTLSASSWLALRPRRLVLAPGAAAMLTVSSALPARAEPGDHHALVLLTTRAPGTRSVSVRARVGVVVTVRVPGKVVHRLAIDRLRARPAARVHVLAVTLANRGNVTERLSRIRLTLRRAGRVVARLRSAPRDLLPRTRGLVQLRYGGRGHGRIRALVEVAGVRRSFWIRL